MRFRARCTLGAQRRGPQGAWWRAGPGPHPPPFRACLLFPHEPTPPCPRRFPFFPFPSPSFHPILVAPSSRRSLTSFSLPPPPCVFSFLTTVTPLEYQFGSPSLFPGFPLPSFRSESDTIASRDTHRPPAPTQTTTCSPSRVQDHAPYSFRSIVPYYFRNQSFLQPPGPAIFDARTSHLYRRSRPRPSSLDPSPHNRLARGFEALAHHYHDVFLNDHHRNPDNKTHTWASKCPPTW